MKGEGAACNLLFDSGLKLSQCNISPLFASESQLGREMSITGKEEAATSPSPRQGPELPRRIKPRSESPGPRALPPSRVGLALLVGIRSSRSRARKGVRAMRWGAVGAPREEAVAGPGPGSPQLPAEAGWGSAGPRPGAGRGRGGAQRAPSPRP